MKVLLMLTMVLLCACEDVGMIHANSCSISDSNYISTHFDCIEYSAEYVFCAGDYGRKDCVDFAPESTMGHCTSENTCE